MSIKFINKGTEGKVYKIKTINKDLSGDYKQYALKLIKSNSKNYEKLKDDVNNLLQLQDINRDSDGKCICVKIHDCLFVCKKKRKVIFMIMIIVMGFL